MSYSGECPRCHNPDTFDLHKCKCSNCGYSYVPFGRRRCKNEKCDHLFDRTVSKCPKCTTQHELGALSKIVTVYDYLIAFWEWLIRLFQGSGNNQDSALNQFTIYVGVVLGIAIGHSLKGGQPKVESVIDFLAACLIGFIVLPSVFQDGVILPDAPFMARFGVAVQRGAFSDLVLAAAEKTLL